MNVLLIVAGIYLAVGFVYATYLLLFGSDLWYLYPINLVIGPLTLLYLVYFTWSGKKVSADTVAKEPMLKGKKAVVFDLDNTIIDTEELWNLAIENVVRGLKTDLEDEFINTGEQGVSIDARWETIIVQYPELNMQLNDVSLLVTKTQEQFIKLFKQAIDASELEIKSGFWGLLIALKETYKVKVGLATNTYKVLAEQMLKLIKLNTGFDVYIYGDDVKSTKPNPEIYLAIAAKLGVKPKEMLVFEDSIAGIDAALAAGARVVQINTELQDKQYPINQVLGKFDDFEEPTKLLGTTYAKYTGEIVDKELPLVMQAIEIKKRLANQAANTSTKSTK